jgi:hypothetical protein
VLVIAALNSDNGPRNDEDRVPMPVAAMRGITTFVRLTKAPAGFRVAGRAISQGQPPNVTPLIAAPIIMTTQKASTPNMTPVLAFDSCLLSSDCMSL